MVSHYVTGNNEDREILNYQHYDVVNITTPVKVKELQCLLERSNYNQDETKFLVEGFMNGFDFHYHGPMDRQDRSKNLPFHCGNKVELWNKVMKEVGLARYEGPFTDIPFKNYIQSPIGLVPKAGGQTRLIFHLSYKFRQSGNLSVNEYMPRHLCTVKYNDLDHAVQNSLRMLEMIQSSLGKTVIWYGKSDLKSAFRILPGKPSNFWIFIMKAEHPVTGKVYYFVDKCMAFGHSISCALFQCFSNALAHLVRFLVKDKVKWDPLSNYLDDFLFLAWKRAICNYLIQTFLDMCKHIGVPVSAEKTEWGDTQVIFLGILMDGKRYVLAVTEEKRIRTVDCLLMLMDRKKATIKELQSLAGLLNFLNRAIHPGRAFTRRMYAKFSGPTLMNLKPHHHVRLDREFKQDCSVWLEFLTTSNASVCRPFVDLSNIINAEELGFFTDAAKGEFLGMGGIFDKHWYFAQWEPGYIKNCNPSIEYLELVGVCTGVFIWGKYLRNRRVVIRCDNQLVVTMINNTTAKCQNCMFLIRQLTLFSLTLNTRVFAKWVKGAANLEADMLSRQKIQMFKNFTVNRQMDCQPSPLPEKLWPASKLWITNQNETS